jgi:phosphoribosylglycinamide formyltransferase-1
MHSSSNLVLFASGGGSNALKIIEYFQDHNTIHVAAIITNNAEAGIVSKAYEKKVPVEVVSKKELNEAEAFLPLLEKYDATYLILAGFLLLMPKYLIQYYKDRIINIHPSLLPKYGGKGMYGIHVHKAVVAAKEEKSGLTIHLVNEEYDKGKILFQKEVVVGESTAEELAAKILVEEHKCFSTVIEDYIIKNQQ